MPVATHEHTQSVPRRANGAHALTLAGNNMHGTPDLSVPVPMSAITAFDYSTLQEDVGSNLRLQAERIRKRITNTTQDMIDIGRDLEAARQQLEHGQFISWVEAEVGISARSAQNYMTMARLADDKGETVSLLSPRAVQRLAAKSAPPEIVQQVLTRARSGDILPEGVVAKLVSEAKQQKREIERQAKQAERRRKEPKKKRLAREESKRQLDEQRLREKQQADEAADTLITTLGAENAALVAKLFSKHMWDLLDALRPKIAASEHEHQQCTSVAVAQ